MTEINRCAACGEYMPPHATHMCANWPLGLDRDEMAADDKGSIFITHEDDNETVTLRVRAPRSTHEATISLPLRMWSQMTEGSWAIGQRQAWIAEMVGIYGFINREHIMRKFGVSTPQASVDLRAFQEQHPDAIFYNSTTKRYELRKEPREIVTPDQSH